MDNSAEVYIRMLDLMSQPQSSGRRHALRALAVFRALTETERRRLEAGIIPHMARIRRMVHGLKIDPEGAKNDLLNFMWWHKSNAGHLGGSRDPLTSSPLGVPGDSGVAKRR